MLKRNLFGWAMMLIALICATSCDQSKVGNILDKVPAEVELVAVGNLAAIIESAGGEIKDSRIVLPTAITDLMNNRQLDDLDELNDLLQSSGVNLDACALVMDKIDTDYPVVIFGINDAKKFAKGITDMDFDEFDTDGDIYFYKKKTYDSDWKDDYDQYSYIGICGSYGYAIPDITRYRAEENKPSRVISRLIDKAEDEPFGRTEFAKFISASNVGGLAVRIPKEVRRELKGIGLPKGFNQVLDGVICMRLDLKRESATMESKVFTPDGKPLDLSAAAGYFDPTAKIDKQALSFLGADEQLVFAVALKDVKWGKYFDLLSEAGGLSRRDMEDIEEVERYLKQIDGTVAFGVGFTNGLESVASLDYANEFYDNMSFTAVVTVKSGKAKSLMADIRNLLDESRIPYGETSDGLKIGDDDMYVYLKNVGDYLIASNNKANTGVNQTVVKVGFADYIAAVGAYLDRNSRLLEDLDISNDLKASAYFDVREQKFVMDWQIAGSGPDGFIARIIKIGTDVYDNRRSISNKLNSYRPSRPYDYDPYDDIPYEYADTIAEEVVVVESPE